MLSIIVSSVSNVAPEGLNNETLGNGEIILMRYL